MSNIYIGSLPPSIGKEELVRYLNELGFNVSLKTNPKLDRRYIMLRTKEKDCYEKLIGEKNLVFKGFAIKPQPYFSGIERRKLDQELKSRRIYVGKLQQWHTNVVLHRIFEGFGKIESCYVSEKCRGKKFIFGFVTFEKEETALDLINQGFIEFEGHRLTIKSFGDKKKKKKKLDVLVKTQGAQLGEGRPNLLETLSFPQYSGLQNRAVTEVFVSNRNINMVTPLIPMIESEHQRQPTSIELSPTSELLKDKVFLAKVKLNHKIENLKFTKRL